MQRHSCIEVSRTKLHAVWKQMLHRLLQGIVFLEERRLAFGGESQRIGYPNNGKFLELISHHDQILVDHLRSRNALIGACKLIICRPKFKMNCANHVAQTEIIRTKCYSIIVDAIPDSSHVEQTAFTVQVCTQCHLRSSLALCRIC